MTTGNGVTSPAQILRQILFHPHRRLKRHRVKMLEKFRQQPQSVAPHHPRIFNPCLVIGQTMLRRQPGHSHIHTGHERIAPGVFRPHFAGPCCEGFKQHNINMVMMPGGLAPGTQMRQSPAFHGWHLATLLPPGPRPLRKRSCSIQNLSGNHAPPAGHTHTQKTALGKLRPGRPESESFHLSPSPERTTDWGQAPTCPGFKQKTPERNSPVSFQRKT